MAEFGRILQNLAGLGKIWQNLGFDMKWGRRTEKEKEKEKEKEEKEKFPHV